MITISTALEQNGFKQVSPSLWEHENNRYTAEDRNGELIVYDAWRSQVYFGPVPQDSTFVNLLFTYLIR